MSHVGMSELTFSAKKLGEVILVPIDSIRPFPNQPRQYFDQQKLAELAASIKAVGQKVPGLVKKINESDNGCPHNYELIDGQRRWHAISMAGKSEMKVIVTEVKDENDQFLISVVANFGRAEHGPLEIASAIKRFREGGMKVTQIAEIFGRSSIWVYQHFKILSLDPEVQKMMSPEIPEKDRLALNAALMLADVPKDIQKQIADIVIGGRLKINQARNFIRRRAEKMGIKVGDPNRSPRKDYRIFCSFLGRMKRELEIFDSMPEDFFEKMFHWRERNDYLKVIESLQKNLEMTTALLEAVKRANSK